MKYLVIDVETSGLYIYKNPDGTPHPADAPDQPRLAELGMVYCDDDFNVEQEYQCFVKPDGWTMTPEGTAINGLTTEDLLLKGLPADIVIAMYQTAILEGRTVVAYNAQFDCKSLRGEARRLGMPDLFEQTPNICAMRSITTNYKGMVKKLNGKGGFPRLIDAAAHFSIPYAEDKRHTALEDALVTAQVAQRLHEMGKLLPAAVHYAKGHVSEQGEAA